MTQSPILNCWCTTCRPPDPANPASMRLALCPTCGNKRCPRAHNHTLACTNSNGCHNRAPFKASTELRDHHGRLVISWPFRMASDCQYTLSDLGQADKACHGCCWRREPMAECTETQPSS